MGWKSFHADDADLAETAGGEMQLIEHELTGQIINCFFSTYNSLGYGFLESPYSNAFKRLVWTGKQFVD